MKEINGKKNHKLTEREADTWGHMCVCVFVCVACVQPTNCVDFCWCAHSWTGSHLLCRIIYMMETKRRRRNVEENMSAICHQYKCSDKRNVSHGVRRNVRRSSVACLHILDTCLLATAAKTTTATTTTTTIQSTIYDATKFIICIAPTNLNLNFELNSKFIYDDRLVDMHRHRALGVHTHNTSSHLSFKLLYYALGKLFDWPNNTLACSM